MALFIQMELVERRRRSQLRGIDIVAAMKLRHIPVARRQLPGRCLLYTSNIRGSQADEYDDSTMELYTEGMLTHDGGKYIIEYDESEISGMENTRTSLTVEGDRVQLLSLIHIFPRRSLPPCGFPCSRTRFPRHAPALHTYALCRLRRW